MATNTDLPKWGFFRAWIEERERSDAWRSAGSWALSVLERELGPRWPERTWLRGLPIPGVVAMAPASTFAFAEMLELALRLDLARQNPGFERLIRGFKHSPLPDEHSHLRVQLEIAGLAARAGLEIELEPSVPGSGRRGDVAFLVDGKRLFVEAAALGRPKRFVEAGEWTSRIFAAIRTIEVTCDVTVKARFSRVEDEARSNDLIETLTRCARFVAAGGAIPEGIWPGAEIMIERGRRGGRLQGPAISNETSSRLRALLAGKADQMSGADNVWIVVHLLDGWFHSVRPRTTLQQMLEWAQAEIASVLDDRDHLEGVVLSNGAAVVDLRDSIETAGVGDAVAMSRPLRPLRLRQVLILPRASSAAGREFWLVAHDAEGSWLDWALARVGLPLSGEVFAKISQR